MAVTTSPPDTQTVARVLDADPVALETFLEHHPNPSVDVVVTAAVCGRSPAAIHEDTRETVARWIADRQDAHRPGPRWRVRVYLEQHGAALESDLLDDLSGERWTRDTLRQAVADMVRGGHAERYNPRRGPERLRLSA